MKNLNPNKKRMFLVNAIEPKASNEVHLISMGDLERIYKEHVAKYPGKILLMDVCFDYDDKNEHDGMITIRQE